jgi:hypothetical protein
MVFFEGFQRGLQQVVARLQGRIILKSRDKRILACLIHMQVGGEPDETRKIRTPLTAFGGPYLDHVAAPAESFS